MNAGDLCAPVNMLNIIPESRVCCVCLCELLMARTAGKKLEWWSRTVIGSINTINACDNET